MSFQNEDAASKSALSATRQDISSLTALTQAVWSRRSEYTTSKQLRVKIGTWNVAAIQGTEKDVATWFVAGRGITQTPSDAQVLEPAKVEETIEGARETADQDSQGPSRSDEQQTTSDKINLYVLGLQEIVDVSSPAEALRPYQDKTPSEKWKSAVRAALSEDYSLVAEQQLVGMYILVYADSKIAPSVSNVSSKFVGTGLMGYMGNKGAVSVRLVLGEMTKMVFINSHLAAGAQPQSLERRNWDAQQIVNRTRFAAIDRGHGLVEDIGEGIGEEDFAFWFGDLNYRLADLPGDDIRRLLMLHTEENFRKDTNGADENQERSDGNDLEADIDPSQDPASVETTIASLLPHDELYGQIHDGKAFQDGWQEGKIRFMPTYKYDVGSVGMFDTSEKKRAPSWCDRILFRSRKHYLESKLQKDVLQASEPYVGEEASESQDPETGNFEYDPENDGYNPEQDGEEDNKQSPPDQPSQNPNGVSKVEQQPSADNVRLEQYTSHQHILSSDHKPLDAIFTVTYTAVDPERKANVHQEVARDFDRLENESRPTLSVAVDTHEGKSSQELIDFGSVRFNQVIPRTITIANTGQVDTIFGFVTHDLNQLRRGWLEIQCDHPRVDCVVEDVETAYRIAPGETWTAIVSFRVTEPSVARKLKPFVEDVLILRVSGGRDHFLTIHARWAKTTLGLSMNELICLPESGVRDENADDNIKCSAPRELFRLTEALESNLERSVAEWGMRENNGSLPPWNDPVWPFGGDPLMSKRHNFGDLVDHVQESLDTGKKMETDDLDVLRRTELYAQVLLRFLDSLDDGVIDKSLWSALRDELIEFEKNKKPSDEDKSTQRVRMSEILSNSTPHNVSFQLLITMIRRIIHEISLSHSPGSEVDKHEQQKRQELLQAQYAEIFQKLLFRPRLGEDENTGKESGRNAARRTYIMLLFIDEPPGV